MELNSRVRTAATVLLALTLALSACSSGSPGTDDSANSNLSVLESDLGPILVDGDGDVLYIFIPDAKRTVSCVSTCTSNWPPLMVRNGELPHVSEGVDEALIDSMPSPDGGEVVTYAGWPLYHYAADRAPGEHRGQNIDLNGGGWLVMQPNGTPLQ